MAEAASMAGATNPAYDTTRPSGSGRPRISAPTPTPRDSRYNSGSKKPETSGSRLRRCTYQLRSIMAPAFRSRGATSGVIAASPHQAAPEHRVGHRQSGGRPGEQGRHVAEGGQDGQPAERQATAE